MYTCLLIYVLSRSRDSGILAIPVEAIKSFNSNCGRSKAEFHLNTFSFTCWWWRQQRRSLQCPSLSSPNRTSCTSGFADLLGGDPQKYGGDEAVDCSCSLPKSLWMRMISRRCYRIAHVGLMTRMQSPWRVQVNGRDPYSQRLGANDCTTLLMISDCNQPSHLFVSQNRGVLLKIPMIHLQKNVWRKLGK